MSNYLVDGADLTSVANAIRTKGGTSAQLAFPQGFVNAVEAIETGGGPIFDPNEYARGRLPSGDVVVDSATFLNYNTFSSNSTITSVSAPNATAIYGYCFYNATGLTSVNFPNVTKIGGYNASGRPIGFSFYGCTHLMTAKFPKVTQFIGAQNFGGMYNWATLVFPALQGEIASGTFRPPQFDALDIGPGATKIGTNCLYNNGTAGHKINTLILRRTSGIVAAAASTSILNVTSQTKVYVPQALIESYKAAANWSAKGDIFYPIEGSIYENAYADGTPIE